MALNEIEFVGNDRYFKYRYTQETTINCSKTTYFEDTMHLPDQMKFMAEYLKRFLNMRLDFEGNDIEMDGFYETPNFFKKSHVMAWLEPSSFFRTRLHHFTPSPPVGISELIIVSIPKVIVTSNSWSFLNMDTEVLILLVLTLVLLSILFVIHSIVTNKYKSVSTKKVAKKMAQDSFETFWENASLLCAEPIPAILPHITCRLLASSWLVGVTFILFFLGCYLRTDFSTESYNCIDSLSDLIKSGIAPGFIHDGPFNYIKDLADTDPVVKEWLDAFDEEKMRNLAKRDLVDALNIILSGERALIIDADSMIMILGAFVDNAKVKELIVAKGGLYFSQQVLGFAYNHFILNTSWIRSIPQLNAQLMVEPMFEKQVFKYQKLESDYSIEQFMWKRPLQSTEALDLSSVSVPFYFLLMLLSGTVAVVFTEIFFY